MAKPCRNNNSLSNEPTMHSTAGLTRRQLLGTSAAIGAAAIMPWLALSPEYARAAVATRSPGNHSRRVIVLGAGLAGLAAAHELVRNGHEVIILEAQSRPGGRVHTLRAPFADGLYAEAGAMFAGGPHISRFTEELGIELVNPGIGSGGSGDFLFSVQGERIRRDKDATWPVDLTEPERAMGLTGMYRNYAKGAVPEIGDPFGPQWPPEALKPYDDMSFAEYLASRGASPAAIALLRLDVLDMYGQGFESMSALAFLRDWAARAHSAPGGRFGVVPGGTDRLPKAMAERLSGKIHYGTEALSIEQDDQQVRVRCRSGGLQETITGDRLVCTLPFSVLRALNIAPGLPEDKQRAINTLPYSTITRVYLQVNRRFWEDEGLNGAGYGDGAVPRVLTHPMGERTKRAVLEAHTGKATGQELAAMGEDERLNFALAGLEKFHPKLREHTEGGTSYAWNKDPWAKGGYASYAPGMIFDLLPVVGRQEGRIHFAGEHTSRLSTSMDGALESGVRTAQEIAELG